MKRLILAVLALVCAGVEARVYRCPSEDAGIGLANAEIRVGERNSANALHGDVDQVGEGTTIRFEIPGENPRWLVCQYGGHRIAGTAISGSAVIGGREVWLQLDHMTTACELVIRRAKKLGKGQSPRSAAASCKRKEPPPPDLV